MYRVQQSHSIFVTGLEFLPTGEATQQLTGGHEATLLSVSADNQVQAHHIPQRGIIVHIKVGKRAIITGFPHISWGPKNFIRLGVRTDLRV